MMEVSMSGHDNRNKGKKGQVSGEGQLMRQQLPDGFDGMNYEQRRGPYKGNHSDFEQRGEENKKSIKQSKRN